MKLVGQLLPQPHRVHRLGSRDYILPYGGGLAAGKGVIRLIIPDQMHQDFPEEACLPKTPWSNGTSCNSEDNA